MDLGQQLVIWKKAGYLLNNIALTPKLCGKLVEEEIATAAMINKIQDRKYNVEKVLHLLTVLGTHGKNTYERFLRALEYSDHEAVSRELQKTAKFTKFGEMMPPCFTYFLDLSEFLRLYPHIAVKLGEAEKYLVQTFIEGKLEMHSRKKNESISSLETEKDGLLSRIAHLERKVKRHKENEKNLEAQLGEAQKAVEALKGNVQKLVEKNAESWNEIRRLKHYRLQQHELENLLKCEEEESIAAEAEKEKLKEEGAAEGTQVSRSNTKTALKREGSKLKKDNTRLNMRKEGSKLSMRRDGSKLSMRREGSTLKREGSKLTRERSKVSDKSSRPDIATTVKQHNLLRIQILTGQVNLLADKQFHIQLQIPQLELEEQRLRRFVHQDGLEKPILVEFKKALSEVRKEKHALQVLLQNGDKETKLKENALQNLRKGAFGVPSTPACISLVSKLHALLERFKAVQAKEMKVLNEKHEQEFSKMVQHTQELNNRHMNEEAKLRGRIRLKMVEIHKREQLHKRLRNQISVLTRYHAKNMNATVSVEQCRKIVRGIIGDARHLAYIADERDKEQEEMPTEQELKYMTRQQREQIQLEQLEKEKKEKKKEARKNKIKSKRKKRQGLTDDRLLYIGDRISMEWRQLGLLLELTHNYMDIIETETKTGKEDNFAFNMLKTWRDEENGKVDQLFEALQRMGKNELALMVVPKGRIEITAGGQKEAGGENAEAPEVMEIGAGAQERDPMMAAVPQLPPIAAC